MIGLSRKVAVFACTRPVDMRKQFDSLAALVTQEMGGELLSGNVFLFVGKNRRRAKALYFDGTGLCVLAKRLEKGRFAALWSEHGGGAPVRLTPSELALFLEGSELVGKIALSPSPLSIGR